MKQQYSCVKTAIKTLAIKWKGSLLLASFGLHSSGLLVTLGIINLGISSSVRLRGVYYFDIIGFHDIINWCCDILRVFPVEMVNQHRCNEA